MKKRRWRLKRSYGQCDLLIVFFSIILVIFGIVMIFSASYYKSLSENGTPFSYLGKQIIYVIGGVLIMYIFSMIDYHRIIKHSLGILILSIILLVLLFTPLGRGTNGAIRWIAIGPITIMPGEIAKFAVLTFTTLYLGSKSRNGIDNKSVIKLTLMAGVIGALIVEQPNLSTAITVVVITFGIMFVAGVSWKFVGFMFGVGCVGVVFILNSEMFWKDRLVSFIDPFKYYEGKGFQLVQSLYALGTGGLKGLGLGQSVQKNLYLPEPQTDFILAVIGEELGFIGIFVLMVIFSLLVWRFFRVAMLAKDRYGMYLASGTGMMIALQVIFNLAIVTSSMPPTGIALPFVSYGGNALWILMALTGMVLNVSRQGSTLPDRVPMGRNKNNSTESREKEFRYESSYNRRW